MIKEFSKVKELPQAQKVVEESIVIYVVEETSKEEPCCIMSVKSIENKEKARVEEKERLVERLCIFDSISIISKESEHFEYSKEKESELEKIMNNTFIESIVVGFGFDGALFDILHDKCLGKFVENVGYVSSSLDTFMENHNDFVSLNQLMSLCEWSS
ncbi:hypothetical protein M9H77_02120 [Catharanthus roseus]|uniref:Uncharacterized protein n=1 Tax=Catharanthus roseus TaxID=4058 RepID=A0ACC0C807_CATRO|nr:hypothetical protein M9H77_02120 [Catharanthus roseus]